MLKRIFEDGKKMWNMWVRRDRGEKAEVFNHVLEGHMVTALKEEYEEVKRRKEEEDEHIYVYSNYKTN